MARSDKLRIGDRLATFARRAALMCLLWIGLNGLDLRSWIVGGPAVLLAAWVSTRLLPGVSWRWRWTGVFPFAWYFLRESARGALDVALMALSIRGRPDPRLLRFEPRLPDGPARLFYCALIGLLPGTLVVTASGDAVLVHALRADPGLDSNLRDLEERVAALFCLPPCAAEGAGR